MPTIYKNGLIYGGSANVANLVAATDSSSGASNVQTELDKRVEISNVTTSTNVTQDGFIADAKVIKPLNDSISSLQARIYTNFDPVSNITELTTKIDNLYTQIGERGLVYGSIGSASASAIGLSATGYKLMIWSSSSTTRQMVALSNSGTSQYTLYKSSSAWNSTWYANFTPSQDGTATKPRDDFVNGVSVSYRNGVAIAQINLRVPAGTYSTSTTMITLNPTPSKSARCVLSVAGEIKVFNLATSGILTPNSSFTLSSQSYILGQVAYFYDNGRVIPS